MTGKPETMAGKVVVIIGDDHDAIRRHEAATALRDAGALVVVGDDRPIERAVLSRLSQSVELFGGAVMASRMAAALATHAMVHAIKLRPVPLADKQTKADWRRSMKGGR